MPQIDGGHGGPGHLAALDEASATVSRRHRITMTSFTGHLAWEFMRGRYAAKIESALNQPPYNYLIHTSPLNTRALDHYHWHFEIIPRITRVAGFEWGSGFYINTVPPEQAASFLREIRG